MANTFASTVKFKYPILFRPVTPNDRPFSKAGTYKLLKDYTISAGRIQIGSIGTKNTNIIFDLGGHTLTKNSSSSYAAIFCNANIGVNNVITIKNGTMDVQFDKIAIQVTQTALLTLKVTLQSILLLVAPLWEVLES